MLWIERGLHTTSIRAADAAWVRWHRWNGLAAEQRNSFAPICPHFLIEVRSAGDRLAVLQKKMEMWVANGVELAWLIDPERRAVEVLRPSERVKVYHDPISVIGTGPVARFELVMERVWGMSRA